MAIKIDNFALIIGSMKCGTTSLFYYLSQHPQVAVCKIKEPNFFASEQNWSKGFNYYQNLWHWHPDTHKTALEASTHYTQIPRLPNAAEKIAQIKADFKFIYIMRNPIERIESHYTHGKQSRWSETKQAIEYGIHQDLIDISRYARQLDEYYKRFPSAKILLIDFEDLKQTPLKLMKKVVRFLDLDSSFEFQELSKVYNPTSQRLIYPFWSPLIKPVAKYFPTKSKDKIRNMVCKRVGSNIQLSLEQREYIFSELREDFKKLSEEYGFEVYKWEIKN